MLGDGLDLVISKDHFNPKHSVVSRNLLESRDTWQSWLFFPSDLPRAAQHDLQGARRGWQEARPAQPHPAELRDGTEHCARRILEGFPGTGTELEEFFSPLP